MKYKKYKQSNKAYIVMQCSGFGVMEAPYVDEEIVFETNDKDEAYKETDRLFHANNSKETIKSSWIPNTYWVYTNTNTEIGKLEYDKFCAKFDETVRKAKESGNYHEHKSGDMTIGVIGNDDCFKKKNEITGHAIGNVIWNGKEWIKIS